MRMIAGSIVLLAGVIPICLSLMMDSAFLYFRNRDTPTVLGIGGGVLVAFGLGLLFWGLARDGKSRE